MADDATTETGQDLVIERVFDAPRDLVWEAWTEPQQFAKWFGPHDYTIPSVEIDLRVGGKMLFAMRSPEGQDVWSLGVFREVEPPSRLVYDDSFADELGNIVPASYYDMDMGDDVPLVMTVSVTFDDVDGKTKMTLRHAGLPNAHGEGANEGWSQSFDKLAEYLAAA